MSDKTAYRVQLDIAINAMGSSSNLLDQELAKYLLEQLKHFNESKRYLETIKLLEPKPLVGPKAPIDPSNRVLVNGLPVPEDRSHTKLKDNGQQQDYVVLSKEEIEKGFVRPVRRKYIHAGINPVFQEYQNNYFEVIKPGEGGCGVLTSMSLSIAETYAAKPDFYTGTFCCGCNKHLPLDQFVWEGTNQIVGS